LRVSASDLPRRLPRRRCFGLRDAYSFLVLFSLGITRGKAGTLRAELLEFKRLYDAGATLKQTLPRLAEEIPSATTPRR